MEVLLKFGGANVNPKSVSAIEGSRLVLVLSWVWSSEDAGSEVSGLRRGVRERLRCALTWGDMTGTCGSRRRCESSTINDMAGAGSPVLEADAVRLIRRFQEVGSSGLSVPVSYTHLTLPTILLV